MIIELHSKIPIYEQIVIQIKKRIKEGELKENDPLPSIRKLASDHRISALTVKKAYDVLEKEGIVTTVQGKGTFIATISEAMVQEEMGKEIEEEMERLLQKAKKGGLSKSDLSDLFQIILEEIYASS